MRKLFLLIVFISFTFICNAQIKRTVDKFSGKITLSSPLTSGLSLYPCCIFKVINQDNIYYYLFLSCNGSSCVVDGKGVTVLFTDGTKWYDPYIKIDIKAASGYFVYSAVIPLSASDLEIFTEKSISDYRLYIFDARLNDKHGNQFKNYINEIIGMN
jgi:hypothetical protein